MKLYNPGDHVGQCSRTDEDPWVHSLHKRQNWDTRARKPIYFSPLVRFVSNLLHSEYRILTAMYVGKAPLSKMSGSKNTNETLVRDPIWGVPNSLMAAPLSYYFLIILMGLTVSKIEWKYHACQTWKLNSCLTFFSMGTLHRLIFRSSTFMSDTTRYWKTDMIAWIEVVLRKTYSLLLLSFFWEFR